MLVNHVSMKGFCLLLMLIITGWIGVAMILTPMLLLAIFTFKIPVISTHTHHFYQLSTQLVQWLWMGLVVMYLEDIYHLEIAIYMPNISSYQIKECTHQSALWISNHRTRIDWMFLWSVGLRLQSLQSLCIILKGELRKLPIFGWAMQHFGFIFLARNWKQDEKIIMNCIENLRVQRPNASYMLFPEGTDLSENNLLKSKAYAEKENVPERYYTLYPRTTGFIHFIKQFINREASRSNIDLLYDMTMFYIDRNGKRPSELSLLSGDIPKMLIIYIETWNIKDIISKTTDKNIDQTLNKWLSTSFTKKEDMLKQFFEENGKLPKDIIQVFQDTTALKQQKLLIIIIWISLCVFTTLLTLYTTMYGVIFYVSIVLGGYFLWTKYGMGVDGFVREHFNT